MVVSIRFPISIPWTTPNTLRCRHQIQRHGYPSSISPHCCRPSHRSMYYPNPTFHKRTHCSRRYQISCVSKLDQYEHCSSPDYIPNWSLVPLNATLTQTPTLVNCLSNLPLLTSYVNPSPKISPATSLALRPWKSPLKNSTLMPMTLIQTKISNE